MARDLRPVGAAFLDDAPHRFVCTEVVRRPAAEVFAAIAEDPAGWGDWFPGFDHSGHWLTPEGDGPTGVGRRRRVRASGITYDETVLEWEPGRRFSFRVDRAGLPIARAFAERYAVAPHEAGAVLQWTLALDPGLLLRPVVGFGQPVVSRLLTRVAAGLEAQGRATGA